MSIGILSSGESEEAPHVVSPRTLGVREVAHMLARASDKPVCETIDEILDNPVDVRVLLNITGMRYMSTKAREYFLNLLEDQENDTAIQLLIARRLTQNPAFSSGYYQFRLVKAIERHLFDGDQHCRDFAAEVIAPLVFRSGESHRLQWMSDKHITRLILQMI